MDFLDRLIDLALDEDLGPLGDVTTRALVPPSARGRAELWAKERMVLSGSEAFSRVFARVDAGTRVRFLARDGDEVGPRQKVAELEGALASLLIAERTALNLIQRTSGISTLTREAVARLGPRVKVLDTRKTAPGMRALSKLAVRAGGGVNHRFGLFDGVLIKDNHIAAVGGSVGEAIRRARQHASNLMKIEAEVTSLAMLREAIAAGADIVLLDNMDDARLAEAVRVSAGRVALEVSGGVTIERLPALARLGVDYVSMGALTHSARAMDLSLEIIAARPKRGGRARRPARR